MALMTAYIERLFLPIIILLLCTTCSASDILGCGGFVKSHVSLDFSKIEIGLYTKEGSLKEKTECAPTNGYYFLPLYEKGDYVLKVHPPAGWSFEPSEVDLSIDGVTDKCSSGQDINFAFNGFGIAGRVITAGQQQGPSGIAVQLINDKGDIRNTVTTVGGDFHFTPVIPGKYTVKASHPRWKLDPSQAVVQVTEGNTALPFGVLAVKGYDVAGTVTSFGSPISGVYVLLYSKEESPKLRVEGCKTALLQGVPDAPICHSITDAKGEFNFGLVPAGEYKLMALSTPPGQVTVTYNLKPTSVPFTVRHDSLFIKNAFEVNGFTVVGSVAKSAGGPAMAGVRVLLDGEPIGKSDGAGKYTLPNLQPATYTLGFQHEECEFDDMKLSVSAAGVASVPAAVAARWRVCGTVTPPRARAVRLGAVTVRVPDSGHWCTFLPPGHYAASVDVSEQEQREGLQYYPLSQQVAVSAAALARVSFSQLKARVHGELQCPGACPAVRVTLRPLSPDGGYVGQPLTTTATDGAYSFSDVLPGSVEVSAAGDTLCWAEARHNVLVARAAAAVPAFRHAGLALRVHASHACDVEYESKNSKGVFSVPAGESTQCVPEAGKYTLTPRGCHRFEPEQIVADISTLESTTVQLVAVAHACVVRVTSPVAADDIMLHVRAEDGSTRSLGPLRARAGAGAAGADADGVQYEHTLYLGAGELVTVWGTSRTLLLPAAPRQLAGRAACQPAALALRAARAVTLAGRTKPAVPDVTLTLQADDVQVMQATTTEDGTYRFGPLDASKKYKIIAEKDSYVFSEPDENGDIVARKLAEITVELLDEADNTPLQGALVSVSGGTYRRNVASEADGRLRFGSLSPAQYYIKPNMKEYRFQPPHHIITLEEGETQHVTLKGSRVAWSLLGTLRSLGGAAWRSQRLQATPRSPRSPSSPSSPSCAPHAATTDNDGAFRIRGLVPNCVYNIELLESTGPDAVALKLAITPPPVEVKEQKDIENFRLIAIQPQQITDANVLVHTPNIEHYKTLRLTLALENNPHSPIYSTKLDPAGYSQQLNPGLMYVLPRLPADNKTYILQLESTLSKATHTYGDETYYFTSDGHFKHFTIEFLPKVLSSEQEVRQTSVLVLPLLALAALAYSQRARLQQVALAALAALPAAPRARSERAERAELLDRASIDQIVSALNPPAKKNKKKFI